MSWNGDLGLFLEALRTLYTAIREVSGADVVVDSSKGSSYGQLLALAGPPLSVHVVHLVRDPRAIVYSVTRRRKVDPGTGRELDSGGTIDEYPTLIQKLKFEPGRIRGKKVRCQVIVWVQHTFVEAGSQK